VHLGKRGNPTIFSQKFYDRLQQIRGDKGGRNIIERHPDQVLEVEIDNTACFFDVDTEKDYEKLKSHLEPISKIVS
jgi:molybdenum cofactor cytidylyltransferase